MRKIVLGLFGICLAGSVSAQVVIQVDGTGPDVAGTIVDVYINPSTIYPYQEHFIVTNNSGSDQQWKITRVKQSVPAGWVDQVCWPPNCYPTSGDVYTTPNSGGNPAPTIVDGTSQTTNSEVAELKPQVTPDQSVNSVALYMYYITDVSGNYIDSVGLRLNFALGIEEVASPLSVEVAPNPASEFINIQTKGVQKASVKIVDVLGNVVHKETIQSASRKIDVSSFKNGIYFVIVEEGSQVINRKIIVRH